MSKIIKIMLAKASRLIEVGVMCFIEKTRLPIFQENIHGLEVEAVWNLVPISFLSLFLILMLMTDEI